MTDAPRSDGGRDETAPGRRFSYWIAQTLREHRLRAGIPETLVATLLDANVRTVARIEAGESWGRDVDRAVWAYAYALGLDDPRDLWREALDAWYRHGAPPDFSDQDLPGMGFLRPIRDQARRHIAARDAPSETPRATRHSKRAAP